MVILDEVKRRLSELAPEVTDLHDALAIERSRVRLEELEQAHPDQITEDLKQNPWVSGVDVQRQFPHTLIITPMERKVIAIAYISSDDLAWAIGDDDTWIAPLSTSVEVDDQVKDISTPSVEAISANLNNGIEVSLGDSNDIVKKERVVTKLLSQVEGVTYINVRSPGNYTFRNAPTS